MNNITIDLNDDYNQPKVIFEKEFVRPVKKVWKFLAERNPAYKCSRLAIECDESPDFIKQNFSELFKLSLPDFEDKIDSCEYIDLNVTKKELKLRLMFHPNTLKIPSDYSDGNVLTINVCINLLFQPNSSEGALSEQLCFELIILRENAKLEISIDKNSKFCDEVVYDRKTFDFGTLSIKNVADQFFSFPLHVKDVRFKVIEREKNEPFLEVIDFMDSKKSGNDTKEGGLVYNETERFNLEINLAEIDHPDTLSNFKLQVEGYIMTNNLTWVEFNQLIENASFTIRKNEQKTELFVKYNDGGGSDEKEIFELRNKSKSFPLEDKAYDLSYEGISTILTGKIGNRATTEDDVKKTLKIKNFEFNPGLKKQTISQSNGNKLDIKQYVKFFIKEPNNANWLEISNKNENEINLPNNPNSVILFKVEVKDSDFKFLPIDKENRLSILIPITYEYFIGPEENHLSGYKKNTHRFEFILKQDEGRNWLSVDFGTSAIVAVYGNGTNSNLSLNLQEKHKEIINGSGSKYDRNIEEFGTPFLSSTMIFDKDNIKKITNNGTNGDIKDAVKISPTIEFIKTNPPYLIPYLKSLIGYKELPENFLKRMPENDIKISVNKILVNGIIESAYSNLLHNYIEPIIVEENKKIESNKVVLSVPNTFTFRHENILRNTFKKILPTIWEDYIMFISESDAVACYYAQNYSDLIIKQKLDTQKKEQHRKERRENGDTILVYDMGAGTLDLTLFKRTPIEDNNFELEIIGKTGFSTAGNYLDRILAEIVYEQVKLKDGGFHPITNYEGYYSTVLDFKMFIKTQLKPTLESQNIADTSKVDLPNETSSLDPGEIDFQKIIESPLLGEYMDKITDQAVDFLKNNLCVNPESIKLKTLIITGRGGQLFGLKEKLEKAIRSNFGVYEEHFLPVTIDNKEMKSMVAKGAIDFVRNIVNSHNKYKPLNIHARIGYLIDSSDGTEYFELFSPIHKGKIETNQIFTNDAPSEGYMFKQDINLNNVKRIIIIQTYYYDKNKIISDYEGDLFDASTILFEFIKGKGVNGFEGSKGKLNVMVCEKGEVFAKILTPKGSGKSPSQKNTSTIDIQNSKSFEKSMWPILQPTKN